MMCENQFCIYWEENTCILNQVHLDFRGACMDCFCVDLPDTFLKQKRQELLQELEARCEEWKE